MPIQSEKIDPIEHPLILEKIEKALQQLENGQFLTSEELDEEIKNW